MRNKHGTGTAVRKDKQGTTKKGEATESRESWSRCVTRGERISRPKTLIPMRVGTGSSSQTGYKPTHAKSWS